MRRVGGATRGIVTGARREKGPLDGWHSVVFIAVSHSKALFSYSKRIDFLSAGKLIACVAVFERFILRLKDFDRALACFQCVLFLIF